MNLRPNRPFLNRVLALCLVSKKGHKHGKSDIHQLNPVFEFATWRCQFRTRDVPLRAGTTGRTARENNARTALVTARKIRTQPMPRIIRSSGHVANRFSSPTAWFPSQGGSNHKGFNPSTHGFVTTILATFPSFSRWYPSLISSSAIVSVTSSSIRRRPRVARPAKKGMSIFKLAEPI